MLTDFTPRPTQIDILNYRGGRMGISAVPGSGKTHVLSALAVKLITSGSLEADQEILIVTLVNSAVDNFETRIKRGFENSLQALYKYRVRTLHGLAHDIVREKPELAGLEERFSILDEREAGFMRREAVTAWLGSNPDLMNEYLDPNLDQKKRVWLRRDRLPDLLSDLALAFIRSCKDKRLMPDQLRELLDRTPGPLPLAELGYQVYTDYQRGLAYRGAVDFDDLIRLALQVLESDEEYLERLRYRFPYILEDEAQDSSRLQEAILSKLAGEGGNWVRVGDTNQAIFETFTTASPKFLRNFIQKNRSKDMPESGRSQQAIIDVANHLISWVTAAPPEAKVRDALTKPEIKPAPPGDPQSNPPHDRTAIQFIKDRFTPADEVTFVADSLAGWLPQNPEATVAVLAPRNVRGIELIKVLKNRQIEFIEVLNSTVETRAAAGALSNLLVYLAEPTSAGKLARAYRVWRRDLFGLSNGGTQNEVNSKRAGRVDSERAATLIRKVESTESYLVPRPDHDWMKQLEDNESQEIHGELEDFRGHALRWLDAVRLPVDQLVLTLGQDIFSDAQDLALAHKLALALRKSQADHPDWRLPDLAEELTVIAKNERRFMGFAADDSGFDPQKYRGKVVVTTMHKAKGLEWDRVYLMSVNNYDFPSGGSSDNYMAEKWFLRDHLNLEAEALEQLNAVTSTSEYQWYQEGAATQAARLDYARERLRLLYVGITRAKKELIISWNTGKQGNSTPSLPLADLSGWWTGDSAQINGSQANPPNRQKNR